MNYRVAFRKEEKEEAALKGMLVVDDVAAVRLLDGCTQTLHHSGHRIITQHNIKSIREESPSLMPLHAP